MKNRIESNEPDRIVIDDGTDDGPWAKAECSLRRGIVIVDSSNEPQLDAEHARAFGAKLLEFADMLEANEKGKVKRGK